MRAEDRRAQLLTVAAKMLSDPATAGASMDDIAAAAGVTKPVLYRHFPSKRALVGEVLTRGIDRLTEVLADAIVDAEGPHQQVEAGFVAFFRFLSEEPGVFDLLFRGQVWNESGFVQELVRFQTGMAENVSLLINVPGMDPAHRRFLGAALVGMCDHAAREWINDGMVQSPEEVAQSLVEMAWYGLRNLQPRT
jgi:AcrR family transcriptional regulator